jgi:ribonuclease BN (tRNA processing enzyme)
MRVTVFGSGDAFSGCGCNAGYGIDSSVLVDCGAPVTALARRAQFDLRSLRLLLITHFHADHTFMLPVVLGACAVLAETAPADLTIAGPPGIREYALRLVADGYGTHMRTLIEERVAPRFVALQDGSDMELQGYRVRAHGVVHSLGPSLAYAVSDDAGATAGFSGDSTLCAGLHRAIEGCGLFVCECTGWDGPVPGGHMWRDEVATLVSGYPDTAFVLSHLGERRTLPGALIAHDLLALDVKPA